nr:MAG TPA: hypothetical protein [Bacteriophage sp.]
MFPSNSIDYFDGKSCKRCIVGLCLDRSSTLLTSTNSQFSLYIKDFIYS